MFTIFGASGNTGSVVAKELLDRGGLYKKLRGAQGVQLVAREIRGPASRHLSRPPPLVSMGYAENVVFPPASIRPGRL